MQEFLQRAAAQARHSGVTPELPDLTPEERRALMGNSRRLRRQRAVGRARMVAFVLLVVLVIASSAALATSKPEKISTADGRRTTSAATSDSPTSDAPEPTAPATTDTGTVQAAEPPRESEGAGRAVRGGSIRSEATPSDTAVGPARARATTVRRGASLEPGAATELPYTGPPSAIVLARYAAIIALTGMLLQIAGTPLPARSGRRR